MCDCAEELERREKAKADEINSAMAALRAQSGQPSIFKRLFGFLCGSGGGGGSKLPFIGGAALLIGLLGYLYRTFGSGFNLKMLFGGFGGSKKGKPDPCEGTLAEVKKPPPPPPPKPYTPCECK